MSRVPVHENETEAINYHVAIYYERIQENPEIRLDPDRHIELIEQINDRYLKALAYWIPGEEAPLLDYEKYKGAFLENMDYLTQVFTKKREGADRAEQLRVFKEKNKKQPKTA